MAKHKRRATRRKNPAVRSYDVQWANPGESVTYRPALVNHSDSVPSGESGEILQQDFYNTKALVRYNNGATRWTKYYDLDYSQFGNLLPYLLLGGAALVAVTAIYSVSRARR